MSIVSDLIRKKITFETAVSEIGRWLGQTVGGDPTLTTAAGDALSILKQGASDAIAMGDTALSSHASDLAVAVAVAVNGALLAATKGGSVGISPIVSAGIQQLVKVAVSAAHAEALAFEAALAAPTPVVRLDPGTGSGIHPGG